MGILNFFKRKTEDEFLKRKAKEHLIYERIKYPYAVTSHDTNKLPLGKEIKITSAKLNGSELKPAKAYYDGKREAIDVSDKTYRGVKFIYDYELTFEKIGDTREIYEINSLGCYWNVEFNLEGYEETFKIRGEISGLIGDEAGSLMEIRVNKIY